MDTKKFIIASLAVFVVSSVLSFICHGVLLQGAYQATAEVWRPEADMNSKMPLMWATGLLVSFLFVFIYTKGYQGKGIMEGVRYGLWIGLLMSIPMAFNSFVTLPVPLSLAVQWFVYGVIQYILLGIVTAVIYKPAMAKA